MGTSRDIYNQVLPVTLIRARDQVAYAGDDRAITTISYMRRYEYVAGLGFADLCPTRGYRYVVLRVDGHDKS